MIHFNTIINENVILFNILLPLMINFNQRGNLPAKELESGEGINKE